VKIPKIIHQIWIGGHPMPNALKDCIKTVKEKHPSWDYILWTDDNLPENFSLRREYDGVEGFQKLCDSHPNVEFGRKGDVLRMEVLWKYGGVYLDTDVEALKPIDKLLNGHELVMGYEHNNWKGTAIIAAIAGSKMLEAPMSLIKYRHTKRGFEDLRNELMMSRVGQKQKYMSISPYLGGPGMWNRALHTSREEYYQTDKVKFYPPEYFYPWRYGKAKKIKDWQVPSNSDDFPSTQHLIHHFSLTWMKKPEEWLDKKE
tara:strand:+ start:5660 stop:6433 length:774 start_codon:yes stop_codon:yes gene_type:complete